MSSAPLSLLSIEQTSSGIKLRVPAYAPSSSTPKLNAWLMATFVGVVAPIALLSACATFIGFAAADRADAGAHTLGGIFFAFAIVVVAAGLVLPAWYHLAGAYLNETCIEFDRDLGVVRIGVAPLPPLLSPGPFALVWCAARNGEVSQKHHAVSRSGACGAQMTLWMTESSDLEPPPLPAWQRHAHVGCPATVLCCPAPPVPLTVRSIFVRHAPAVGRSDEMWSCIAFMVDGSQIVLFPSATEAAASGVAVELHRALGIEKDPDMVEVDVALPTSTGLG